MTGRSVAVFFGIFILGLHMLAFLHVNAHRLHPSMRLARYLTPDNYFPGCEGPAACQPLPVYPELQAADFSTFNLTENQLKALCKDLRDQTTCHMQHSECIPENMRSLVEPLKAALTKQWEMCDDPNLYTDFLAIKSCAEKRSKELADEDRSSNPIYLPFGFCPYVAMVAGKSAYDELARVGFFGSSRTGPTADSASPQDPVRPAEMLHGVCCAGRAVTECGIAGWIGGSCSGVAVESLRKQLNNTMNALNCSAVTATRPCELDFNV